MNVSITSYYGNSPSAQAHAQSVTIGSLILYFSYETIVAFDHDLTGLVMRENTWSPTTGKHLNTISTDRSKRVGCEEFLSKLQSVLNRLNWTEEDQK